MSGYARSSSRSHGAPQAAAAAIEPSPGKRTLVEQSDPVQRQATSPPRADVHQLAAHGTRGAGGPLPFGDRIQRLFGRHDVSHVQAHTGGDAADAARAMSAEAFAVGSHVAFAGTPTLHTAAHEAAHVVQQTGTLQLAGGVGRVGDDYERHADAVADLVVQGRSAESLLDQHAGNRAAGPGTTVQRKVEWNGYFNDHDGDPPVADDNFHIGRWMEFQAARDIYSKADLSLRAEGSSLLDMFDSEPGVTLRITSSDKMPPRHAGNTSLYFVAGSKEVFVDPSTRQDWEPLALGGAPAIVVVALDSRGKGGEAAYTLNHEMSMHATEFLKFIRKVRTGAHKPTELADKMLGNHHAHHKKIHSPGQRLNVTHERMLEVAGPDREALEAAYFEDKEQYDAEGHTEEQPRQGHSKGEHWDFERLSARSPLAGMKIDEERTVVHNRVRTRVKRTGKNTFQIWCAANQVNPYNAVVAVVEE